MSNQKLLYILFIYFHFSLQDNIKSKQYYEPHMHDASTIAKKLYSKNIKFGNFLCITVNKL